MAIGVPKIRYMTHDDLIQFYGSQSEVAKAANISSASVSQWKTDGVPEVRQLEFHKLTGGKCKADPQVIRKYRALLPARATA